MRSLIDTPVVIPDAAAAVATADDTAMSSAETAPLSNSGTDSILEYKNTINVAGTFKSSWKAKNVPGQYEVSFNQDVSASIHP